MNDVDGRADVPAALHVRSPELAPFNELAKRLVSSETAADAGAQKRKLLPPPSGPCARWSKEEVLAWAESGDLARYAVSFAIVDGTDLKWLTADGLNTLHLHLRVRLRVR